jgi:hypothetical protein
MLFLNAGARPCESTISLTFQAHETSARQALGKLWDEPQQGYQKEMNWFFSQTSPITGELIQSTQSGCKRTA